MDLLPSYHALKTTYSTTTSQRLFIEESRNTVRAILNGLDPRLLIIAGPCSIHDLQAAKEFAQRFHQLADEVSQHVFLVMRVYCEKPRTTSGWKGILYDPHLDGSDAMQTGIEWSRKLFLDLTAMGVPTATEFLDPLTAFYYDDLITWGSIGARTASSQIHRNLASSLSMPVGIKNGIAGNLSAAVNGVLAASHPHTFMRLDDEGKPTISRSRGNPDAHIVLRGGEMGPNYDPSSVSEAIGRLSNAKLPLRLLVDCAHHNSGKQHDKQPSVFQSVIHQILEGNQIIRGLMLESNLHAGNQNLSSDPLPLKYGVSITDPCLDWQSTACLIRWGCEHLQKQTAAQASL